MIMEPGIIELSFSGLRFPVSGFLAEAAPTPSIAWQVVLTLGVLIAIAVNIMTLVRKNTTAITPDPLRIEKLDKLATREFVANQHNEIDRRLNGHDADIARLTEDMKDDRKQNEIHASSRSANLHGKIEAVRTDLTKQLGEVAQSVAALESATTMQNQQLARVESNLMRLVERNSK